MAVNSEAFDKVKKSSTGKADINATVSDLLNHLNLINETIGWTEDNRIDLEHKLYNDISTALYHYAQILVPDAELHPTIHEGDQDIPYNVAMAAEFPEANQNNADQQHVWSQERYHDFGGQNFEHEPLHY